MSDLIDSDDSNAGELGRDSSRVRGRRVQLGDLPHEIKDLIVRHCHDADNNIDSMIRDLWGRGGLPADSDCSLYDLRRTYRRTVAVLYEVSKEWRSLCAPYRFEKLSTSKVADDFFQLVIAPTHGRHFVSVRFDATTSDAIIEFIKALPFLPNLRTINLTRELLDGIRHFGAPLRQALEERLDLVIGTGIRDLTLHRLPLNDTVRFTARAPNVTSLTLFGSDPSVIDELWRIILPMRHLATLSLTCVATAAAEPFQTATLLSAQPKTKPALSSLVLYGHLSTDGLADFIAVFASNLRHLTVGIVESASQTGAPQPVLPACSFPRLRSLALKLPEALQQTTLDAMPGPPQLPNWRTLTTSRQQPPLSASSIASFARLFARHTGVKHVLSDSLCIRVSLLDSFNPVADSPSRLIGGNTSDKYPIVAMTDSDTLAERLQHDTAWEQRRNTLDAIDDVLAYAIERRKRIAATEDWADAARFVKHLGHLDLERMIHRL